MKTSFLKKILIYTCLTYAPLSCAVDQNDLKNTISNEAKTMQDKNSNCTTDNRILVSQNIFNFIIEDIVASYGATGGGGISSIKQKATYIYEASLPQEGKIDVLTYELSIDESCAVSLINKSESVIDKGHR